MGKHWAVIIGINQYQALQPLMHAQFDAIELRDFLTQEVGLPPEQCTLLTDVSPIFYESATYPAKESLEQKLQGICQNQLGPEDTLWVFFSGYGVSWEGQDFILLIDAEPARIPETAISLEAILKQLKAAPTENVVVVLDMNRSQSAIPNQRLGVQTLELAKSLGIPLLLSCQPDQFSQEALAIRHGLFTAALLEGMRYHGRLVLSQLVSYVEERVPELCQLYARPVQNPIAAIPSDKGFLLLLPPEAVTRLPLTESAALSLGQTSSSSEGLPLGAPSGVASPNFPAAASTVVQGERRVSQPGTSRSEPVLGDLSSPTSSHPTSSQLTTGPTPNAPTSDLETEEPTSAWQKWGLVTAGLLLLGVLVRNQAVFLGQAPPASAPAPTAPNSANPPSAPPEAAPTNSDPKPLFPSATTDEGAGASAFERGRVAVTEQKYGEALTWLAQVPLDQRNDEYASLLQQAEAGYQRANLNNQDVLNAARSIMQPISASVFSDAIKRARQVPVGDPYYEQAQQDINRWSLVILDLADGRAAAGAFDEAIAAVKLMPDDRPELYQVAQERIARWQQQKVNRDVLKQAQARLVPDQVNTFEASIKLVRDIPQGYPEYPIAQERIEQWSQDILVIARARAAEGRLEDAIAAAQSVPEGTSAYEQAQKEIQAWQSQI
ncbi:MAG TPA: caspase family protein [Leptolyngbyaceae cyanobacterium]